MLYWGVLTIATLPPTPLSKGSSTAARTGLWGLVCSSLGCIIWLAMIPFLDPCDQGEQLARYFAALFNLIVFGVVGIPAMLLLTAGLVLSRRALHPDATSGAIWGTRLAYVGFAGSIGILARHLPWELMILF